MPEPQEQSPSPAAPSRCHIAIVGGGIVGLAVARELTRRRPRLSVCLLEREPQLASHQSGHSSGVIHAGVYYAPGSLKARLCVQGARELYAYCAERGVPHQRSGKLIIATQLAELPRLAELERRGRINGVPGLRRLDAHAIAKHEPHARGIAALHSPASGIVSFPALAHAFAHDAAASGASIVTGCHVHAAAARPGAIRLEHSQGATEAQHAIFCAGAWADRLAVAAGAPADPRIVPFRGAYLRLPPEHAQLVRSLIYPVPDPALPFLGVHLTRHIDGHVLLGPTALLALARDPRRPAAHRRRDILDTLTWPGSWRLFARSWRTGAQEITHALLPRTLARAAARYIPELDGVELEPAFVGIRAQALGRHGRLVEDFVFSSTPRALHVRNAPSPAATASLAVARHIVERAGQAFALSY